MAIKTKSGGKAVSVTRKAQKRAPPVRLRPSPPFVLWHHPNHWQVKYGQVLPYIKQARLLPGVNNVDQHGRWDQMRLSYEREGNKLIPEDIMGPGTSYIRRHDGHHGPVHEHYCTRVYPGSDALGTDHEEYERFLKACAAIVDPPPIYVLEMMLEKAQKSASTALAAARNAPEKEAFAASRVAIVKVIEAQRDAIHSATLALEEPSAGVAVVVEEPKPKKKRKRRTVKKKVEPETAPEVSADV